MYPFVEHKVDWEKLNLLCETYSSYENVLLLGAGGQVNSVSALYGALSPLGNTRLCVVNTQDPDFLLEVKEMYPADNTLVIASSKSGETQQVLQTVKFFGDYACLAITANTGSSLGILASENGWETLIVSNEIGGRFSGTSEATYLPLMLVGIDCEAIDKGARNFYGSPAKAKLLAQFLHNQEQEGYFGVYMPIYNKRLSSFSLIIAQLFHETVCKDEKGQSFLVYEGPDSQHHSNQRFFGGRRDMVLVTLSCTAKDTALIDGLSASSLLQAERKGVEEEAEDQGIPVFSLQFSTLNESEAGSILALFQLTSIFLAELLGVNPFDQPAVESSKERTKTLLQKV